MDESAHFTYFQWEDKFATDEKPYYCLMDIPDDFPRANFKTQQGPRQEVHDIRHDPDHYALDSHAFVMRKHCLQVTSFDDVTVQSQYLPRMEELIRAELGPEIEVVFFDWRVRSQHCRGAR